ncbi:MAG: dephospho-CoA kinase [Phycisphaerales bacterium]
MPHRKPILGLVGGIGSGKSAVARVFASLGGRVIDADADAKRALLDPAVIDELVGWWGKEVLDTEGRIDRHAVASIVFHDPAQKKRLESLIHPIVAMRRDEQIEQAMADDAAKFIVLDVPLLLEAGYDKLCDRIIFVDTDRPTRLTRLHQFRGPGWDDQELARREKNQWPLDKKKKLADDVVDNNASEAAILTQVSRILRSIL